MAGNLKAIRGLWRIYEYILPDPIGCTAFGFGDLLWFNEQICSPEGVVPGLGMDYSRNALDAPADCNILRTGFVV